ncbi:mammalian cell entry protein [Mycobacterium gordonae]|uniref:Mammalian cell entry protein n=1 Tax=Mycobacterium gordonae TaxID=1778 RepID=A0A1A6BD16_MYCGO|nr:mammalian cell entry protein [Mycobacterium sp.]MBX9978983.1 mammalian cell entry protein [Mycobacterium gordonae]OBS00200.1 mammalian cell entry protein [Mycobacterium gordonae]
MEDQQPAAGDLTETAETAVTPETDATAETGETAEPVAETGAAEGDSPEEGEAAEAEAAEAEAAEPVKQTKPAKPPKPKRKRRPGRLAAVVVALVAALFIGSSAFAAAMVQPYLAERATVEIKLKVARAAANAITTLWSYTPENMDTLADRAGRYLTGDFGAQYRKFVEEKVVGPNKQLKITNSTEVTGVAVESLDGPNATVIVYTNTTATTPLKKNIPSLQYLSYRMSMKREGDRWLVTRMTTITSLDVTPQL